MLKYSICASEGAAMHEPVLFRDSYYDAFSYAKKLGFTGLEIHLRHTNDIDANKLMEKSRETGVSVAAVATGLAKRVDGLSFVDDDANMRKQAIERVKGHLDLASNFGCPVIIGSMRSNIPSHEKEPETKKCLSEALLILDDYIAQKNCTIILEAINRYECNYLNSIDETAQYIKSLKASPKVQMLVDTFHMNIEERNMTKPLVQYKDLIAHIHFADNTRWYPGHGQIDFKSILQTLEQIDFKGWVSFEYLPLPTEEEGAKLGIEHIRSLLT